MADWFSDNYGADGSEDTASADPITFAPPGVGGNRVRVRRASITVLDSASGDVLRMFTMKSSDRIYALYYNCDGNFSASNSSELGLFTYHSAHTGAVKDVDLFGAALDLTATTDVLTETFSAGALTGVDRGKALWAQLAVGAGSDTTDPGSQYDVAMTLSGEDDATSSTLIVWALYSGGS